MTGLSSQQELTLLRKRARRRLVGAVAMTLLAVIVLWNVVDSKPQQDMHPESVEIVAAGGAPLKSAAAKVPPAEEQTMPMPVEPVSPVPAKPVATPPPKPAVVAEAAVAPVKPAPRAETPKPEAHPAPAKEPKPATASKSEDKKADSKPVSEPKADPKPTPKAEAKPVPKAESKPEPKSESRPERKSDPAAILAGKFDGDAEPTKVKSEAKAADKPKPAEKGGHFVIQVAALADPDKARELKQKLSSAGVSAQLSKVQTSKGEVSRVRVGPFSSQDDARAALARINKAGVSGIVVPQ